MIVRTIPPALREAPVRIAPLRECPCTGQDWSRLAEAVSTNLVYSTGPYSGLVLGSSVTPSSGGVLCWRLLDSYAIPLPVSCISSWLHSIMQAVSIGDDVEVEFGDHAFNQVQVQAFAHSTQQQRRSDSSWYDGSSFPWLVRDCVTFGLFEIAGVDTIYFYFYGRVYLICPSGEPCAVFAPFFLLSLFWGFTFNCVKTA